MNEFCKRLSSIKRLMWEILLISFVINCLGLASSVYSIQVLNRYLSLGIDSTLITLTIGAILALSLELLARTSRLKMVQWVCAREDKKLSDATFEIISNSRFAAIESVPVENRKEALTGLNTIQMSFGAQNLISVLDGPFSLVFLFIIFMLSHTVAIAIFILLCLITTASIIIYLNTDEPSKKLSASTIAWSSEQSILSNNTELVRTFNMGEKLNNNWNKTLVDVLNLRKVVVYIQNLGTTLTYSSTSIQTILIYSLGAREVMAGNLDVGSLIGISILASRSLNNVTKILHLVDPIKRGERALESLSLLARLPSSNDKKMALSKWQGNISMEDLAFAYQGQAVPIIEYFNINIKKGSVVAIKGGNGTGKTTFARLLCGIIDPTRGRIKIDGMDLRQADPFWWKNQFMYLPQEPTFFNGTLKDNLIFSKKDMEDNEIIVYCQQAGLINFLDNTKDGLYMQITNNGHSLPLGIRRRIALVRALIVDGQMAIFDEPTEALDVDGCKVIASVLSSLAKKGKTIMVMTNEDFILKAANLIIDLNKKPTAEIIYNEKLLLKGEN